MAVDFCGTFNPWVASKVVSVCFIVEGNSVWLTRAKNRRGQDKSIEREGHITLWEPVGGKIAPGETPLAAIKREIAEELDTEVTDLNQLGVEYANFSNQYRLTMNIFKGSCLTRPPKETNEVECRQFKINELPRGQVWDSDFDYWPCILTEKQFHQYSLYDIVTNRLIKSQTVVEEVCQTAR